MFMPKKRVRNSKVAESGVNNQTKTLLIATVALLSALLILNVVSLTGYSIRRNISGNDYFGDDTCTMLGGIILREGTSANYNGKIIRLDSTSESVIAVSVDNGKSKGIRAGHDGYVDGIVIKNFASNENDACLILG